MQLRHADGCSRGKPATCRLLHWAQSGQQVGGETRGHERSLATSHILVDRIAR
jgi:hypothetical protein